MAAAVAEGRIVSTDMSAVFLHADLCGRSVPVLGKISGIHGRRRSRRQSLVVSASSAAPYGPGGGSEIVDANMNVLWKRIHRMQSMEAQEQVPDNWMEWEKTCYSSYRADLAYLLAGVQNQLLGIRPSVSLFFLSVILSALPVGSLLILRFVLQQWVPHL